MFIPLWDMWPNDYLFPKIMLLFKSKAEIVYIITTVCPCLVSGPYMGLNYRIKQKLKAKVHNDILI